jgi:hypothetical protein
MKSRLLAYQIATELDRSAELGDRSPHAPQAQVQVSVSPALAPDAMQTAPVRMGV